MELESQQHRVVGVAEEGQALSGEQRKRLSIAVEMVANPSVLFMDEPTSGLDARAAAIVMRSVKAVAQKGSRTVMVTIHQPTTDIFLHFDQLLLLQLGGRVTYFGLQSELVAYLEAAPGVEPIRKGSNPATWMLEVTGGSMATTYKHSDVDFPERYTSSDLCATNMARLESLAKEGAASHAPLHLDAQYATSGRTQRRQLLWKYALCYWRSPDYNATRILMTCLTALVYGIVYINQGKLHPPVEVATVQNIMGMGFSIAIFLGMFNAMNVQPLCTAERMVFWRERAASMYSPFPFALAMGLSELPYLVVQTVLMACISYWMVGFAASAWKFFYFLALFFLCLTMYSCLGQMLVFATPNQLMAQLLVAALNQIFTIFNGFLQPLSIMPRGWQWLNRISPTTYILQGISCSQLCDNHDVLILPGGQTTTISAFMSSYFDYKQSFIWWCLAIVGGYCCFFVLVSTVLIRYVSFQKR